MFFKKVDKCSACRKPTKIQDLHASNDNDWLVCKDCLKASLCKHERWDVQGENTIGHGICLDCKREVCLDVLFRGLKERMERAMEGKK